MLHDWYQGTFKPILGMSRAGGKQNLYATVAINVISSEVPAKAR